MKVGDRVYLESTVPSDYDLKSMWSCTIGKTEYEIVAAWCGWHIGDESWWHSMKDLYDELTED
jgi:hypothetical protein